MKKMNNSLTGLSVYFPKIHANDEQVISIKIWQSLAQQCVG